MPHNRDKDEAPQFRTPWFWWITSICLAACFAAASWAGVTYLFTFPEKPENYELLDKLNQLPKPPEFSNRTAPKGQTYNSITLHDKFFSFPENKRDALNLELRRQLVSGFEEQELIYYIEGSFEILEIRDLNSKDFVNEGLVIKAQASILPDEFKASIDYPLIIEYILPNAKSNQKILYPVGSRLEMKKVPNFCTALHFAERLIKGEKMAVLTILPIVNGVQKTPDQKNVRVKLPQRYQIAASLPIFDY